MEGEEYLCTGSSQTGASKGAREGVNIIDFMSSFSSSSALLLSQTVYSLLFSEDRVVVTFHFFTDVGYPCHTPAPPMLVM